MPADYIVVEPKRGKRTNWTQICRAICVGFNAQHGQRLERPSTNYANTNSTLEPANE